MRAPPLPGLHDIATFVRLFEFRTVSRWMGLALIVGAMSGLAAVLFFVAADWVGHLALGMGARLEVSTPAGEPSLFTSHATGPLRQWVLLLVPTLGGLVSGFLVWRFRVTGPQGTDGFIRAFHHGKLSTRAAVVRALASVVVLGTGGSVGREGPVALLCGAIGKRVGQALKLSERELRLLLLAGAAGGIAAIFRSPLGAALFVLEVLYRDDFEVDAIVPTVLASVVGYSVFTLVLGEGAAMFATAGEYSFRPLQLPFFLVMALGAAAMGIIYTETLHRTERWWHRFRVHEILKPMLGGLMLGCLALVAPHVLGAGYGLLQDVILDRGSLPTGWLGAGVLLGLAFTKVLSTSLTHSSNGSGGVFGPSVVIGGLVGGAFGVGFHELAPEIVPQPGAFVLVGMACFVGGVANAPISTLVMASEMTGRYDLLVPVMFAEVVTFAISRKNPLYTQQVLSRRESPAHGGETVLDLLQDVTVRDTYEPCTQPVTVRAETPVSQLLDVASDSSQSVFPVVDQSGAITGLVSLDNLRAVFGDRELQQFTIVADCVTEYVSVTPVESLASAMDRFASSQYTQLPVAHALAPSEILGFLNFDDLLRATRAAALERGAGQRPSLHSAE